MLNSNPTPDHDHPNGSRAWEALDYWAPNTFDLLWNIPILRRLNLSMLINLLWYIPILRRLNSAMLVNLLWYIPILRRLNSAILRVTV